MRRILPWGLWLWICAVIYGAFEYAPLAAKFIGQSSRILFFHVPMAWTSFVAFFAAGFWSVLYLMPERWPPPARASWRERLLYRLRGRRPEHDRAAAVAIQLGLAFGILATVTGSLWARIMWNSWWNWDPRQTSIVVTLLFYGAYLALRDAIEDGEKRGRLSAAYSVLGLVVTPFFYFVVPRITYSLHPDPVINSRAKVDVDPRMLQVLLAGSLAFTVLFFWMHNLQCRLEAQGERLLERKD